MTKYFVAIPYPIEDCLNYKDWIEWLQENNIIYKLGHCRRRAIGFPDRWECNGPVIYFENEIDMVAFKLRWL